MIGRVHLKERKTMKKIIYRNANEVENFDLKRFVNSLAKYAKVSEKEAKEALADYDQYETMHVSCLVEAGMKLIGAKDAFVRQPFVVEGIFIGLIGSAIPLILLYFIYGRVIRYAAEEFNFLSKMVTFIPVETIFRTLVPISLILGIGIGWVGSRVTLHKHLRV